MIYLSVKASLPSEISRVALVLPCRKFGPSVLQMHLSWNYRDCGSGIKRPFGEDTGRSWLSAMEAGKTDGCFYKLDIQNETGLLVAAGPCSLSETHHNIVYKKDQADLILRLKIKSS